MARSKAHDYACMLMPEERNCEIDKFEEPDTTGLTGKKLYSVLAHAEYKKNKWKNEHCAKCGWEYSEDERRREERHHGEV